MEIKRVWGVYWSAVGNTKKVVATVAESAAKTLGIPCKVLNFTLPATQKEPYSFAADELVVFGTPTYAGKIPNKILPWVQSGFMGGSAPAIAVVTFGNRAFDNALAELTATLEKDGFHTVAAGAFACRHVFSDTLAVGRPDAEDLALAEKLGAETAEKVKSLTDFPAPVQVPGDADAPYYVPRGVDGAPAKFLKAKPVTDLDKCVGCGLCARVCPMSAINPENVAEVPGICIKCHACVRRCPMGAKSFDDAAFLSHKAMLESNFQRRAEAQLFQDT